MPFIPHTPEEERAMLDFLGMDSLQSLFREIPDSLRAKSLTKLPEGISEMELIQSMESRARMDEGYQCFLGAGAYDHYIPSAIWDLVSRGEFLTAYTPYQAEASQGTLQLIYEFQSMITQLTGMDVANASVYDGASALAEAVLMAVRANKKSRSRRILCAGTLHPAYAEVCKSIVGNQGIELVSVDWDRESGILSRESLTDYESEDFAALVVSSPSFFGTLEDTHFLTDWAHARNMLLVGVVNPISLGLLVAPGSWGSGENRGADIVVGEGQPLGIPLASGGPYLGFMCCKQEYVRQMPGRIIGRTEDMDGKEGFALTLQAREQHIRRAKATSNICTNQGLLVTAATIYMSLMGAEGLRKVALGCHANTKNLLELIEEIPGVKRKFSSAFFHESVVEIPADTGPVLKYMLDRKILAGLDIAQKFPDLSKCLLINVTETKTETDLLDYKKCLEAAINSSTK